MTQNSLLKVRLGQAINLLRSEKGTDRSQSSLSSDDAVLPVVRGTKAFRKLPACSAWPLRIVVGYGSSFVVGQAEPWPEIFAVLLHALNVPLPLLFALPTAIPAAFSC